MSTYRFPLKSSSKKGSSSDSAFDLSTQSGKAAYIATLTKITSIQKADEGLKACDFSRIQTHLENLKNQKQLNPKTNQPLTAEEKKKQTLEKQLREDRFKFCLMSQVRERVGNYAAEPPNLFRGRGLHPKQGVVKPRCVPEDVSLNLDLGAQPAILDVHKEFGGYRGWCWGDVFHDNTVAFLGSFEAGSSGLVEAGSVVVNSNKKLNTNSSKTNSTKFNDANSNTISNMKYIHTAASSTLKMVPDVMKYEKAKTLGTVINKLRQDYWLKIEGYDEGSITENTTNLVNHRNSLTSRGSPRSARSPRSSALIDAVEKPVLIKSAKEFNDELKSAKKDYGYGAKVTVKPQCVKISKSNLSHQQQNEVSATVSLVKAKKNFVDSLRTPGPNLENLAKNTASWDAFTEQRYGSNPDAKLFINGCGFGDFRSYQTHCRKLRQLGVASYFIDRLALRVGNSKDETEEADTVGCSTLRVEHVKCLGKVVELSSSDSDSGGSKSKAAAARHSSSNGNGNRTSVSSADPYLNLKLGPTKKRRISKYEYEQTPKAAAGLNGSKNSKNSKSNAPNNIPYSPRSSGNGGSRSPSPVVKAEKLINKSATGREMFDQHLIQERLAYKIELNFLGKDSIPYVNQVLVPKIVHDRVQEFMSFHDSSFGRKKKKDTELLFDLISSADLNDYFKEFLPGLTAKVFRTFNASYTLEKELDSFSWEKLEADFNSKLNERSEANSKSLVKGGKSSLSKADLAARKQQFEKNKPALLLDFFNTCNRAVAVLCNHQRAVPSSHGGQVDLLKLRITTAEKEREFLAKFLRTELGPIFGNKSLCKTKSGKEKAIEKVVKKAEKDLEELIHKEMRGRTSELDMKQAGEKTKTQAGATSSGSTAQGSKTNSNSNLKSMKKDISNSTKQSNLNAKDPGPADSTKDPTRFFLLKSIPDSVEVCTEKLMTLGQKLSDLNATLKTKEENKNIALGTSKTNYIDPRITVAFCKRVAALDIAKVFSKTHLEKFPWALDVEGDYRFKGVEIS